jgi:hypothetical protein
VIASSSVHSDPELWAEFGDGAISDGMSVDSRVAVARRACLASSCSFDEPATANILPIAGVINAINRARSRVTS